jgi:Lhr-like helicase
LHIARLLERSKPVQILRATVTSGVQVFGRSGVRAFGRWGQAIVLIRQRSDLAEIIVLAASVEQRARDRSRLVSAGRDHDEPIDLR